MSTAEGHRFRAVAKQVLPPLPLLLLAYTPPDFGTDLFWLLAVVVSLISLVGLGVWARLFTLAHGRERRALLMKLPRPLLTILFSLVAGVSVHMSYDTAIAFSRRSARVAQAVCDAESVCPARFPGWRPRNDSFASQTRAGNLAKYRVMYGASTDRKTFVIVVRKDIDDGLTIRGGTGLKIRERQ